MGNCNSNQNNSKSVISELNYEEFVKSFGDENVETADVVLGIDATKSNEWSDPSNHFLSEQYNVYERVIVGLIKTFNVDSDSIIPLYFFGSEQSNKYGGVLHAGDFLVKNGNPLKLIEGYRNSICTQTLSGPTRLTPLLEKVAQEVEKTKKYTILIIITDGAINAEYIEQDKKTLVDISKLPLAVTSVGIGNGNFDAMESFDDMRGREIDNFQFTKMNDCVKKTKEETEKNLWHKCLMEIPEHHRKCVKKLGYKDPVNNYRLELESKAMQSQVPQYLPASAPLPYNPLAFPSKNPPSYQ